MAKTVVLEFLIEVPDELVEDEEMDGISEMCPDFVADLEAVFKDHGWHDANVECVIFYPDEDEDEDENTNH